MSAAALALLALLAAAPDAGAPALPAAQAADSALATAERAISEARAAGAAGADLAAASALLDRARKARRQGELDDAKRLSDEAWELARKAREGAAARTRFSVGVGDGDETRIAVRSGGPVGVEAGAERLAVQAGQGVRARPGAKLEVGPLPAAPSLLEPADGAKVTVRRVAVQGEPVLAWSPVPGAVSYEVRLSRDPDFKDVVLKLSATAARAPLRGTLPPGEYAWRAVAVDARGLAGPASAPRRLEVVERPPRLEVEQPVWK